MRVLKAKKVREDIFPHTKMERGKTYYMLSESVDTINTKDNRLHSINKEDFRLLNKNLSKTRFVCISDARTHTERMLFPAFPVFSKKKKERILSLDFMELSGVMTMMTFGGNSDYVYDHQWYINDIAQKNNFDSGIIVEE